MNKKDLEFLGSFPIDEIITIAKSLKVTVDEEAMTSPIAVNKLKEKVIEAIESNGYTVETYISVLSKSNSETKSTKKEKKDDLKNLTFGKLAKLEQEEKEDNVEKRAMKLKRCMISCNNQDKRNWQGEIFTVQNSKIGEVKKYVPFNVVTHVPAIMYNVIKERKLQIFYYEKVNCRRVTKTRLINEFNIQDLPPITSQELEAIKKKQLAEASV